MDDEYGTLLVDAYKGELFGEALFEAFAARESDRDHVTKLRLLERIEGTTASQLRPLVDAAGIAVSATDIETVVNQGREIGRSGLEWDAFVKGLHDALPAFLANFVRLRTLASDANDPSLVALVAHEQAINAFAELELSGRADCSIAVLHWHLESVA
jgi:hypothetical protein